MSVIILLAYIIRITFRYKSHPSYFNSGLVAPVVGWKSLFDNFSSLRSGRVPSTTLPQLVWNKARSPKECLRYSFGKEIAQKSPFDNLFCKNSFDWTGIGKAATTKKHCMPSLRSADEIQFVKQGRQL